MNEIIEVIATKKCSKCGVVKSTTEFYTEKHGKNGLRAACKVCREISKALYRKVNKERLKIERHIQYNNNIKQIKLYNETHKEQQAAASKSWNNKNIERIRKKRRINRKIRYSTEPSYVLEDNLRSRLRAALKGIGKSARTMDLLGCTIEELKKHLESNFKEGMTWENKGFNGWHIDHIIPCACFDLTDSEQQKKCFHYTNLQPLWAKDNLSKGSSLNGGPINISPLESLSTEDLKKLVADKNG